MTTFEVSNLGRYGFMGGRGGSSLASQMGHRHQHQQQALGNGDEFPGTPGGGHVHRHNGGACGCGGFLMQLTGMDVFTKGKAADGLARAGKASNPFDLGIIGNCRDFWSKGRELGVEYDRLYDVPVEGFQEAKRRREREEQEDERGGADRRKAKFMGFNIGLGRNRAGYEPVSQV